MDEQNNPQQPADSQAKAPVNQTPETEAAEATPEVPAEERPTTAEGVPDDLMAQIDALQQELQAAQDKYMRSLADMENLRKRLARERDDIRRTAASNIIEDLLPAMDNLRLGLQAVEAHPEVQHVTKGFEFVAQQFEQILAEKGLEKVEPPQGEIFDPNLHEAVGHEAHNDVADNGIITVQRPGYTLNGRLLRPASVVVSSGPSET